MSSLEAPGADTPADWASVYRARGEDVVGHRPVFTGDIFLQVSVPNELELKDVIVLQHPCAIRTNGITLVPRLLVAEVRPFHKVFPNEWETKYFRHFPLIDFRSEQTQPHHAAFFVEVHVVPRENLVLERRHCCLSQKGVNLLMQRWVHHNSRAVIETWKFQEVSSPQFEEADMIEEWCTEREFDDVSADEAAREVGTWLDGKEGEGQPSRRELLLDPQRRSALRQAQRRYLQEIRKPPTGTSP